MPYAGVAEKGGPAAVKFTFVTVRTIWQTESFKILSIFSDEDAKDRAPETPVNVAVFGKFRYRSTVLGKRYTSPFSFWCKVDMSEGSENKMLVVEMQFMEDTVCLPSAFGIWMLSWDRWQLMLQNCLLAILVSGVERMLTTGIVRYQFCLRKVW